MLVFKYKKSGGGRSPRINEAIKATIPGTFILHGEGTGPHEWEQSADGGETSIPLHATREEKNIAADLLPIKGIGSGTGKFLQMVNMENGAHGILK